MKNKICFVIQPFDEENTKRYNSFIKTAIEEGGFTPYRVDEDKTIQIPIENIEKTIKDSDVCFVDISTDNPNVWYELGFAIACEKKLVIICSDNREKYPFDIQHRHIIKYKQNATRGSSVKLKKEITERLKSFNNNKN